MGKLLQKTLELITGPTAVSAQQVLGKLSERQLIELEAQIGGTLFGPIPAGHKREFFMLDEKTWVWHEEWLDEKGKRQITSTRYEIHANGILKAQNSKVYKFIKGEELKNLVLAMELYYQAVARGIYRRDPATGQKLPETDN